MDLTQRKLSKTEWNNIEIPLPPEEKSILQIIINGYHDLNLKENNSLSLLGLMKIDPHISGIHYYLYNENFDTIVKKYMKKYKVLTDEFKVVLESKEKKVKLKKGDIMRINLINDKHDTSNKNAFEYELLKYCEQILKYLDNRSDKYAFYLYTLIQIKKASIKHVNKFVLQFVDFIICQTNEKLHMKDVLSQSYEFIERNSSLLKYSDKELFDHQKNIYNTFKYNIPKDALKDEKMGIMSKIPPKLVLYTAPTGTGKTLTPLGLSEGHRIIFICAARHVGLALAKSAVCMNKKIAIAFGCETADDIRLHYYAASEYSINKRSGGIGKVDNSIGNKVQIMICDIKSYLIAMHYMMSFTEQSDHDLHIDYTISNMEEEIEYLTQDHYKAKQKNDVATMETIKTKISTLQDKKFYLNQSKTDVKDYDLITYWDEPTISMDYDEHPLHELINNVWKENKVSKVVLSCATLPHEEEIQDTLIGFRGKFDNAEIETISSFDCRKSIALLNEDGKSVVPHLLYENYDDLQKSVAHCNKNKTLLRYFDLVEIVSFIELCHGEHAIPNEYRMEEYFQHDISEVTMNNLKLYYLLLLRHVDKTKWNAMFHSLTNEQKSKLYPNKSIKRFHSVEQSKGTPCAGGKLARTQSVSTISKPVEKLTAPTSITGLHITTNDAQTLTDGPTIYLANNIENVANYYIKQTNLPERVFQSISQKIANNSKFQEKLTIAETKLEEIQLKKEKMMNKDNDKKGKGKGESKIANRNTESDPELTKLYNTISNLQQEIQVVNLDEIYIPNSEEHQMLWNSNVKEDAFRPNISDDDVCKIMATDVSDQMKLLLLLGIGMFSDENTANHKYMEIMKKLAYDQNLYVILASSDYIYGTNYQFCHGYIGKDLKNMTQQKTIQAMGRIGRNQTQQQYTIRFRDNNVVSRLFQTPTENKEAIIMNALFS